MGKSKNITITAQYTFLKIELNKDYTDKFQLTFVRGKQLERSDLLTADKNHVLILNTSSTSKCHLQKNPCTGKFKQKKLKVILHRFVDPATSRVYAHVNIDLGEFYGKGGPITKTYEMITQHQNRPILTFSCQVNEIDKLHKNESAVIIDTVNERVAQQQPQQSKHLKPKTLLDNSTEPVPEENYTSSQGEERYLTESTTMVQNKGEDSDDHNDAGNEYAKIKVPVELRKGDQKDSDSDREKENSEDEYEEEEEETNEGSHEELSFKSGLENLNKKTKKTVNTFLKMALNKEALKIHADEVLRELLSKPIPEPTEYAFMDPGTNTRPFPGGVFPIYQTLLKSNMFVANKCTDEDFQIAANVFYELYPSAPLCPSSKMIMKKAPPKQDSKQNNPSDSSNQGDQHEEDEATLGFDPFGNNEDQFNDDFEPQYNEDEQQYMLGSNGKSNVEQCFLTTLIILLLSTTHSAQYGFSAERITPFTEKLVEILNEFARKLFASHIGDFEEYIDEFASGRFRQSTLLHNFMDSYQKVVDNFDFLPSVNKYVINCFNSSLDAMTYNKILSNPARFQFSKAALWNSFLTSLASENGLQLKMTSQAVQCIMMAINIATENPAKGEEDIILTVCPDLDKNVILYIIKNYRPDKLQDVSINYQMVAKRLEVDLSKVTFVPMKPRTMDDYQFAGENIKLTNWDKGKEPMSLLQQYPFMKVRRPNS